MMCMLCGMSDPYASLFDEVKELSGQYVCHDREKCYLRIRDLTVQMIKQTLGISVMPELNREDAEKLLQSFVKGRENG